MALLTTLDSGMYSPTLCIRAGVFACNSVLIPDSGRMLLQNTETYNPNWPQLGCLKYQNARINGQYSIEDNFEQGYFNFENWSGQTTYSTNGLKSGYQSNVGSDNKPYLVNFWGRGNTAVGNNALYKYNFESNGTTVKQKNITTSVVMSGVAGGPYHKMEVYNGTLTSGDITIYGRVGVTNTSFSSNDRILGFSNSSEEASSGDTGWLYPTIFTAHDGSDGGWTQAYLEYLGTDDEGFAFALVNINTFGFPWAYISQYVYCRGYNVNLLGNTATSIEVAFTWRVTAVYNERPDKIGLYYDEVLICEQSFSSPTSLPAGDYYGSVTFTQDDWGELLNNDLINGDYLTVGFRFKSQIAVAGAVDYIRIKVDYISAGPASFDLLMRRINNENYLCWKSNVLNTETYAGLNSEVMENNNFANFLVTYSNDTGYASFYYSKDDEPLTLRAVDSIGDISPVFRGITNFYEESHNGNALNNPKIITDYGVSNRLWTTSDIYQFNQHRLNPAYYLTDSITTTPPTPSGSDTSYVQFHFPVKSSGQIGSCNSGNYQAINYYIPLTSGVSERLYEFDRSQFNNTALALDMWVENSGTNPSGNLGARIDFCDRISLAGKDFFTVKQYWSGFPILINNDGIHQVRMSGLVYNNEHNPSDLVEVTSNRAMKAQLYYGAWYNNIHTEYNGDIKIYSSRVTLAGWCTPPSTGNALTLYTSGQVKAMESLDLYLQQSTVWDGIDLYIQGTQSTNSGIPLYIAGDFAFNQFPLYIGGKDSTNSGIPLTIIGGTESAAMPLYIYSEPASQMSGNVPLYMWATTNSGMSNSMSLFIGENAPSGVTSAGMNLYVGGPDSARVTAAMPLFLKRDAYSEQSSFTLYCHNAYTLQSGNLTMFLQAPSGTLGAIPVSGAMNLFIARDSESAAHNMTLYTTGPNSSSESLQFYINGGTPYFSSIPLYTKGIGETESDPLKLYTHGF